MCFANHLNLILTLSHHFESYLGFLPKSLALQTFWSIWLVLSFVCFDSNKRTTVTFRSHHHKPSSFDRDHLESSNLLFIARPDHFDRRSFSIGIGLKFARSFDIFWLRSNYHRSSDRSIRSITSPSRRYTTDTNTRLVTTATFSCFHLLAPPCLLFATATATVAIVHMPALVSHLFHFSFVWSSPFSSSSSCLSTFTSLSCHASPCLPSPAKASSFRFSDGRFDKHRHFT